MPHCLLNTRIGVGGSPRTSWNSRVLAGDERGACSSWCDVCIGRGVEGSMLSAASVSSMENGSMMVCNGKRNGFSSGRRAGAFLTGPVGRRFKCVRGGNRDKNVEDAALDPYRLKELPCYVFRISARPIWCRLGPTEFRGRIGECRRL